MACAAGLLACSQKDPDAEGVMDDAPMDDSSPADDDATSDDANGAGGAPSSDDSETDDAVTSDDESTDDVTADDATTEPPPDGVIPDDVIEEYFPLVDGSTWTYRHTKVGEMVWDEVVNLSAATGADAPGFQLADQPNRDGEVTEQLWRWVDTAVVRISRRELTGGNVSVLTTYEPGFTRFDTRWTTIGFKETVTYTRTEQKAGEAATSEARSHEFEVLDTDASVTIDETTYDHCLLVARTRPDTAEVGQFWFARGIGKVKELDPETMTTEELVAHSIP